MSLRRRKTQMLTINHELLDGHSSIFSCKSVRYEPNPPKDFNCTAALFVYGVDDGIGCAEEIASAKVLTNGTVFVMNESGSTVGRYVFYKAT